MGIASGVGHFFESIIELIQGFLGAIVSIFEWVINSIIGVFQSFVHFVEGTLGFAIHNFFILGTVAAAVFAYMLYTQRQGTAPISRSVRSKTS
ncbi:uncharacterized protein GGS25DRAFT_330185 [Hypoxylon fragiforme]|uniref:uncharacterized protein n=1 Tax=Hypoxylon fragiforme TaxID=63214 RepID=UPI0020C65FCE|nr:uncharacterized protein GGS25DRAFT_330185 [Hypoxylon fragiforme]KAI2607364.1 hypothetical protein GGS25DRAFT_330185 [Hypoxylon fragiforme]